MGRELPELAAAGLAELVQDFLAQRGVARAGIDHWIVHPGGRRIIESVRDALSLSQRDVATSWESPLSKNARHSEGTASGFSR